MRCLRCDAAQDLVIALDLRGVSHISPGHDTVYDWSVVVSCPSCDYGELRSFSHDCWAPPWEEEWDMEWSSQLPPETLDVLKNATTTCPDPAATACECPTHTSLRDTRTKPDKLRLDETPRHTHGTGRPDAHVALRDDGTPEFVYTPKAQAATSQPPGSR